MKEEIVKVNLNLLEIKKSDTKKRRELKKRLKKEFLMARKCFKKIKDLQKRINKLK